EAFYVESVLRMPHGYICYSPSPTAPEVGPLPALTNGYITFGCFNSPAKFSRRMIEAWAEILCRVPNSRLLLKYFSLADQGLRTWLLQQLTQLGVREDQLLLEGPSPQSGVMDAYNRVDIALDTQPYSGGLTTCEALWMGVPVITFPGKTFAGR